MRYAHFDFVDDLVGSTEDVGVVLLETSYSSQSSQRAAQFVSAITSKYFIDSEIRKKY
jgi:hypothetical protein